MMKLSPGSVLLTDLYELTMLQAYFDAGMNAQASFELFVRGLPAQRGFLMAAGLEQAIDYLEHLRFTPEELSALCATGRFTAPFLKSLEHLRFSGDVDAMREGTVFFANEPVIRITAPMREAQLVESRIMNLIHFETLVASKAARCVLAAPDKLLVDFGLRRAHGAEAALLSARASYLAGFAGTATLAAGLAFDIPVYGTMAHSYVQSYTDEALSFENFARSQPANAMLLIDTYNVEEAARKVVTLAPLLAQDGIRVRGVRIDSGDLSEHARRVRRIFDDAGLTDLTIFASGTLDEYRLRALTDEQAPIDGFGVGTRVSTSSDAPYLDCAYKLVEYNGEPRRKRSEGKATWPGRKAVYRRTGANAMMAGDWITLAHEARDGEPLLEAVMRGGNRCSELAGLASAREHAKRALRALPNAQRSLGSDEPYPVAISDALRELAQRLDEGRPASGSADR